MANIEASCLARGFCFFQAHVSLKKDSLEEKMIKKNSAWEWANDAKIVKSFENFSKLELRFLAFICAWPALRLIGFDAFSMEGSTKSFLDNVYSIMWWIAVGVLVSRRHIFSIEKIHNFDFSLKGILQVNKRLLIFCVLISFACFFWIRFTPKAFIGITDNVKLLMDKSSPGFGFVSIIIQEIQYRLVLYYSLNRFWGRNVAIVFGVLCFALPHSSSFYYPIAIIPISIVFNLLIILTGSLIPSITLHSLINLTLYIIFK